MNFGNADLLRVLGHVVAEDIQPNLESAHAQTAARVALLTIEELRKRESRTPALLTELVESGLEIVRDMRNALGEADHSAGQKIADRLSELEAQVCSPENLAGLRKRYQATTALLEQAGQALTEMRNRTRVDQERVSELLKAAAWWEWSFHEAQGKPLEETAAKETGAQGNLTAEKLGAFIGSKLPEASNVVVDGLSRVPGGMGKETYFFTLDTGIPGHPLNGDLVARKMPPGAPLSEGSFDVRREFALLDALKDAGLCAPRPYWLANSVNGVDGAFYVLEKRPGQVCGTFIATADDVPEAFWLDAAAQLAKLHTLSIESIADYLRAWDDPSILNGTAADGTASYVTWFKEYWNTFDRFASPVEIYLFDWLTREIPSNNRPPSIVHGDFGAHNILRDGDKMSAILDWEGFLFGDPAFDLAYVKKFVSHTMPWQRFLDHYYACGGPETDESSFVYYDTLQATRIVAFSAMTAARMSFSGSNDLKDLMLALGFLPEMVRLALTSADRT